MPQPPLAETLQLHEGLVRGLARGVLGLDDRVEDVVQETWRTALEKAPRDRSRLRAWLAAVARNRALTVLRRDAARRRHERAVPVRGPAASTADIVAREETRRRLVQALLGQPEPYRGTLLLRYYEGCGLEEIARRTGVERETAKTRLRRGLERLRRDLRGDGKRLALLVPLALAGRATAAGLLGGVVMGTKLKLAALAVVVAAAGLVAWQALPDRAPDRAKTTRRASAPPPAGTPGSASAPAAVAADVVEPEADAARLPVRGRLVDANGPVAGEAAITVVAVRAEDGLGAETVAGSTIDGVFALDVARLAQPERPVQLEIRVDHPRYLVERRRIDLPPAGAPDPVVVTLAPAAVATGLVVRPDGAPATAARVSVFRAGADGPDRSVVDEAGVDERGFYRLRVGGDGAFVLAARETGFRPAARVVELRLPNEHTVAPLQLREGVAIAGRLRVNGGTPPPGAVVCATSRSGHWAGGFVWTGGVPENGNTKREVGPDGTFVLTGLAPGAYGVGCAGLPGAHMSVYQVRSVDVEAPAVGVEVDIARARLEIVVTGAGEPLDKAQLAIHAEGSALVTAQDGRYATWVRPGLEYTLEVGADGFEDQRSAVTLAQPGEARTLRVDLERLRPRATLALRVRADGVPPETLALGLTPEGEEEKYPDFPPVRRTAHRVDGAYTVSGLEPGRYRLSVRDGTSWFGALGYHPDAHADVVLTAGATTKAEIALRLGGRLRLAARTPDGRLVQASCALRDEDGKRRRILFVSRSTGGAMGAHDQLLGGGWSDAGSALPAGRYTAEIAADGYEPRTVELVVRRGETTEREVALRPR